MLVLLASCLLLTPSSTRLQIDKQFTPKQGAEWSPGYHGTLYNLTDDAIQVGAAALAWSEVPRNLHDAPSAVL